MDSEKIFELAEVLLPVFINQHKEELGEKAGIALSLIPKDKSDDVDFPSAIFGKIIGIIPIEKQQEKSFFANEKTTRLYKSHREGEKQVSSFQSEDIPNKKFGGGIEIENYFISGSNFPPHLDQKFILLLSLMAGELSFKNAFMIDTITSVQQEWWKLQRKK